MHPHRPFGFKGRQLPQHKEEIIPFVALMVELGVRRYLEIGLRQGTTFHFVGEQLARGSTLVGVDIGAIEGHISAANAVAKDLRQEYGHNVEIVWGDSRDAATIAVVDALGPFDAVFIDGGHTYSTVKADWLNFGKMATKLVAFHDIVAEKLGVKPLWDMEIKPNNQTQEYVGTNSGMGIGVVRL